MAVLLTAGFVTSPMSVREQGEQVQVGRGNPRVVIWLGANANETPRQLRTVWRTTPEAPVVLWVASGRVDVVPEHVETLVLLGEVDVAKARQLVSRAERVLVFGARFAPEAVFDAKSLPKVQVYLGEFSNSSYYEPWKATGRCVLVDGEGDFVEDWVRLALGGKK
jgi:hypothetical protein